MFTQNAAMTSKANNCKCSTRQSNIFVVGCSKKVQLSFSELKSMESIQSIEYEEYYF